MYVTTCEMAIGRQNLAMKWVCAAAERDPRNLGNRRKRPSHKNAHTNTSYSRIWKKGVCFNNRGRINGV